MKIHLLFVFLILIIHNGFGQIRNGKDYALFFANSDYSSNTDFNNLQNPIKDAQAIAEELKDMYGFEAKVYENYTRDQIYGVLEQWQKRSFGPNDQVFLFFSGHGTFWEFTKTGYFVPNTANSGFSNYIELPALGNIVTQIPCRHILLAVDACYSGTIDQEIAFRGEGARRPGENTVTDRKNIIERQLRNQSRLLITSGGKERTPDGHDHSPFAEAILEGLRAAYTIKDGLITYTDLLGRLERVSPTPHQGQLPQHEQGGFVFVVKTEPVAIPDMVLVEEGSFQMGSNEGEDFEKPAHTVHVDDFYIGRFEVTFNEYDVFCKATNRELPFDEGWGRSKLPVINVSWLDAVAYCNWLSKKHQYQPVYHIEEDSVIANWNANGYRLPTEAEWEFAARSRGKDSKWAGSLSKVLSTFGNFCDRNCTYNWRDENHDDGHSKTAPVGSLLCNDIGAFDMTGNVYEWCWDWYGSLYYHHSPKDSPKGPVRGTGRVFRGGSWLDISFFVRSTYRDSLEPSGSTDFVGFRLCRSAH